MQEIKLLRKGKIWTKIYKVQNGSQFCPEYSKKMINFEKTPIGIILF